VIVDMTRPKADAAGAKPTTSSSRRKARTGSRRQEATPTDTVVAATLDAVGEVAGTDEQTWQADIRTKASLETSGGATDCNRRGWGELPAAERASRSKQLEEMGFTACDAKQALIYCAWDVNKALDHLFTHGAPALEKNATTPTKNRPSTACDSTSASGGSTPRLRIHTPPQQALSSDASTASLCIQPDVGRDPVLPPGLAMALPPGLDMPPQVTACSTITTPAASPLSAAMPLLPVAAPACGLAAASVAPLTNAVSVVPKRHYAKVKHTWECEENCSQSQLSVEENEFIHVWVGSTTESGWTYGESLICCSRAGWLPESMLQKLPPNKFWMRISTSCRASASCPTQLSVESGSMVSVDIMRGPVNGYVYVEDLSSATGRRVSGVHGVAGWVPIQCIEWAEF
jgi:hypothetical protein